jgi:hypothetical protein
MSITPLHSIVESKYKIGNFANWLHVNKARYSL